MADGDEITFSAGPMDKGIQVNTSDFQQDYAQDFDSYNWTQGIYQGQGPRYGFSPLPGQLGTEAAAAGKLNNMQLSEANGGTGFKLRRRVLGAYPIKLPNPSDVTTKVTTYAFIFDTTAGTAAGTIDVEPCATISGSAESVSADIRDGFGVRSGSADINTPSGLAEAIVMNPNGSNPGTRGANFLKFLTLGDNTKWYANTALASVSVANVPMKWMLGNKNTNGDATHAPDVHLWWIQNISLTGTDKTLWGGIPSEYNLGNFSISPRVLKVITLTNQGVQNIDYSLSFIPTTTVINPNISMDLSTSSLVLSGVTATKDTAGVAYATAGPALVNDPLAVSNPSYTALLIAQKKAYICLFQDGWRSTTNSKSAQWVDPTQRSFDVQIYQASQNQNAVPTATCWAQWPDYIPGTAMATIGRSPSFMAAGTGVLRANTIYEITYALYNKRLNVETNVGTPAVFMTGTDEFVGLSLYRPSAAGRSMFYDGIVVPNHVAVPFVFSDSQSGANNANGQLIQINQYEIRFYYRKQGEYYWLPAGSHDASYLWFYPWFDTTIGLTLCTGAVAGTLGGEPGSFNDYAALPQDQWDTTVVYKNRAFWFSQRQGIFSLANNMLAYPGRNAFASPTGEFRGAIVHNYAGQAEQNSRLVIFGTKTNYVGRFTGRRDQVNVQVSPDTSFPFEVDGSDFVCDPWTSATAFSSRAAAIADGVLFYWGPQGIYEDGGVEIPQKISIALEPTIFTLYDPNKVDEIHAHYNTHTKEVMWFYPPKTADGYATHCIIFNVKNRTFGRAKFVGKIDWTQDINIETNMATAGLRTIAGCRASGSATVQRAYFFDEVNRAGDMYPTTDFVVKSFTNPTATTRTLTLATGFDAANFATMAVNDYLTLQQAVDYATSATTINSMLAKITALNAGAGTITIQLPTGATMDATYTAANQFTYFPIWHSKIGSSQAGLNGITYQSKSIYWMPGGPRGYYYWEYLYLLVKLALWKSDLPLTIGLGYRSPTSNATYSDSFVLTLNSDNYAQVFKRLAIGAENMEGQALRYTFSGIHAGHEWVLQYLETRNRRIGADVLAQFMS